MVCTVDHSSVSKGITLQYKWDGKGSDHCVAVSALMAADAERGLLLVF